MSSAIRLRACVALVQDGEILLVPHYDTDVGPVKWVIPGGRVEFGEGLQTAAVRELQEETGLQATVGEVLDVTEVIMPDRPWHSVTITFSGSIAGGELVSEAEHRHGVKMPRWFSAEEIGAIQCHPKHAVEKALSTARWASGEPTAHRVGKGRLPCPV